MVENTSVVCWICGKHVRLKDSKSDNRGHRVHEDCSVAITMPGKKEAGSLTEAK